MKKILTLFFLLLLVSLQSCKDDPKVYVCTGPYAYAYHSKENCPLMTNNCSGSIKKIPITKAKKEGRKECGKCYKHGTAK